jgi:cAMP phosphodiesterase
MQLLQQYKKSCSRVFTLNFISQHVRSSYRHVQKYYKKVLNYIKFSASNEFIIHVE